MPNAYKTISISPEIKSSCLATNTSAEAKKTPVHGKCDTEKSIPNTKDLKIFNLVTSNLKLNDLKCNLVFIIPV